MNRAQQGFGAIELIFLVLIVTLVGTVSFYVFEQKNKTSAGAITTKIQGGEIRLHGKITEDTCYTDGTAKSSRDRPAIGDVGCSITVNGYSVGVRSGNLAQKNPGTVSGLNIQENQVGQYADVYAKLIDSHTASIWDASKYYVVITTNSNDSSSSQRTSTNPQQCGCLEFGKCADQSACEGQSIQSKP